MVLVQKVTHTLLLSLKTEPALDLGKMHVQSTKAAFIMWVFLSGNKISNQSQQTGRRDESGRAYREALAVCTPPAPEPSAKRPGSQVQREGESGAEASQAPGTSPTLPQPAPSRARTLEAGGALGEARPGQSSLSAGALRYRVVLDKTLESPLDCKEIQPVCPKGNQS